MPILVGPGDNFPKIILGQTEMKEAYLGNVLIWQNDLPPQYAALIWDGTSLTIPDPFGPITGNATSFGGPVNGTSNEIREIALTASGIFDPDNNNPDIDKKRYIVGYRLRHPDGTYIAGDPASEDNRSDGAPISEFGAVLPGTSSTWDSTEEEFTNGSETVSSSTIVVEVSAYKDKDRTELVDGVNDEFYDAGVYKFTIINSFGTETENADINVTVVYQEPTGGATGNGTNLSTNSNSPTSFTNATIGGPSNAVLAYTPTGGPLTLTESEQYQWSCVSGCSNGTGTSPTYTVAIPQNPSGSATPARVRLSVLGRSYDGTMVNRTTIGDFYFRSGAACSALYLVNDSTYSLSNGCAQYGGTPTPASGATSITCSGDCTGFSGGTGRNYSGSFSRPYPGCPSGGVPQTATVTVSGGSISIGGSTIGISSGSTSYTGSTPSSSYECLAGNGSNTYSNSGALAFASSPTCTDTTPATMNVSGNASCRVSDVRPGGPACGTPENPSTSCGSVAVSCSNVPKNSTSTASVSCPGTTTVGPNTTISLQQPGTFEWNAGSKALCYSGTVIFAGVSTHRIGGAVSITWTCTGDNNDVETIRRNEGTSGHGPGSWTETDFGTDCEAFSSQAEGSSITCEGELRYFISGWGNVTASVPSQTIST